MNRLVLPAILAVAALARGAAPQQGQLDANQTLFTVMAALNAAGYSADLGSPNNNPLRDQVRSTILKKNLACLPELHDFYEKHRQHTDTAELSQYISYALSVKGPPDFLFTQRDVEIPPDVAPLKGLSPLLARFYKEANIPDLWQRSQPAIDQYIARYHEPAANAVLQVNAYLRQVTSGFKGRGFQIYIELLAAPNQVQTRSYGYDYTIVLTPSPEPRTFDIRHAYLHYLLDPLATRNQDILDRKKPIFDHAQRAQALDEAFRASFLDLTTECLIKAIESRVDRKPAGVDAAFRQGFILTPFFAEQLPLYEKQEQSMAFFYPEMVKAIDLRKEDARISGMQFDKTAPEGAIVKTPAPTAPAPLSGAAKTLDDAEQLYAAGVKDKAKLEQAKRLYQETLQQTEDRSLQASANFGLARIAALERDPETADRLFRKTLELQPDSQVRAWTLVYLGRLALAASERDEATDFFQAALKVDGAPEKARQAAKDGLQTSSKQ